MGNGMSENGFSSENKTANRNNETRKQLTRRIIDSIDRELHDKKQAEAAAQRRLSQGNGKFIKSGSDDRVNGSGFAPDHIYQGKMVTEDDRRSYFYGYTTHGGRRLLSVVEELIKENKLEEVAQIAERDYNNYLEEENLGMVASNPVYMEAYRKIASKGKTR